MDEGDDSPIFERPLTEAELGALRRSLQTPPAGPLRFFAAFLGIIPLVLLGLAVSGTPFVPVNYVIIVLVSGFLGMGLGTASRNLRTSVVKAVSDGIAREVSGVPEIQTARRSPMVTVELGGLTLKMRGSHAKKLLPGRMNRLVYAEGGRAPGAGRKQGLQVTLVLEWNGTVSKRPDRCYRVDASGPQGGGAKGILGPKAAGGGR